MQIRAHLFLITAGILQSDMGGIIPENWRIIAATLFSAALVTGAYILARGVESPTAAQASTETALLQAIATKDSDGDGLPDWEEALYGTDPHIADTNRLGMTDGEAVAKGLIVPKAIADIKVATSSSENSSINYAAAGLTPPSEGSLTDAFAKNFFTLYVAAKQANGGATFSDTDIASLQNQALSSLTTSITTAPDFKSLGDLTIRGEGAEALKAFAVQAEAIFKKNKSNATTSELIYLQYATENNDAVALSHLVAIAKSFRNSAAGLVALPVPRELASADLALINAMMRVSEIDNDFTRVEVDPLTTMLALQQFTQAEQALWDAFAGMGSAYSEAGINIPKGTPGASFLKVITDMSIEQTATLKP